MPTRDIIAYAVAVLAVLVAGRCYLELWRWAKQCQRARIAVAYGHKVQLEAPLTEWLTWINSLDHDQKRRGRVVYRGGKVTVAILRPIESKVSVKTIRNTRRKRQEVPSA